jgi:dTDP-4-dehydrorhamnose reductase
MKWLVIGAGGMLGRDVVEELTRRGGTVTGLDRAALDITSPPAVDAAVREHGPGVVVNCAAYTAVDDAETDEARALEINGAGPRLLARACAAHGARLIHVSTDYVFSGVARTTPYPEDHPTGPRTAYGRTKLAGEQAVLEELPGASAVVRTAWLYGAHGRSFVRTMIELESRRDTLDVVDDQRGQPTWSADVAERIADLGPGSGPAGTASSTPRTPARPAGTNWPARCSPSSAPTPTGCAPRAARPSRGPRPARRTAPSHTAGGRRSVCPGRVTGAPPCTKHCPVSARKVLPRETP